MSAELDSTPPQEHIPTGAVRRFPAHERLDSAYATLGSIMKGKGGKPKTLKEDHQQSDNEHKPLSSRMLVSSMLVLVFCLLLNQVGLFVPVVIMARNCILSKQPSAVRPKYPVCSDQTLADEMTIVGAEGGRPARARAARLSWVS